MSESDKKDPCNIENGDYKSIKLAAPEFNLLDKRREEYFQTDKLKIRETRVIEVTKCVECPFYAESLSDLCVAGRLSRVIPNAYEIPDFCPLKSKQITVKLKQ